MTRRLLAAVLAGVVAALVSAAPAHADPVRDAQWHLETLSVAEAHEATRGAGVIVAVIDSGVDADHPDLRGSVLPGHDLTGPGDGRIDIDGHGTGTAGLIVGHGRVLGIAPEAKILPVRNGTVDDVGFQGKIGEAVTWAVANGASLICIAESGPTATIATAEAVERALAADIVVIAGVGNTPKSSRVEYPAAYPGVIAVAGVDQAGRRAAVSVSGPEVVIAAPAVDIVSSDIRSPGRTGYKKGTGTSDATAIVAGAAALVRAKFPDLSAAEVVHRLTATADDKGAPGRDPEYGYGIVNIVRALTAEVPPATAQPSTTTPSPTQAANQPADDDSGLPTLALAGIVLLAILAAGGVILAIRVRS
jgi:type VII secretion-associated serine protease mycosin